jgi:hypothetical protein
VKGSRDSWIEAFRYIHKKDLIAILEDIPDDAIIYQSPVTAGLVVCEQTGPEQDMSDEIRPYPDGRPVMTPPIELRQLITWYADGSFGIESLRTS